jgi:hypothetical protein
MTAALHSLKRKNVVAPRILEIGSWIGFSTFTWAHAINSFFHGQGTIACIDPWEDYPIENQVHGAELTRPYRSMLTSGLTYDLFMHNISYLETSIEVQPLRGRSDRILPLLREKSFDLIYVDGDHSYEAVRHDIENSLPLLKPGGILCGDDLELEFGQCDADHAMNNRNAQPALDPKTGRNFHPGVTLAVHELIGSVKNYLGFWAVTVGQNGRAPLNLDGEAMFIPGHIQQDQAAAVSEKLKQLNLVR